MDIREIEQLIKQIKSVISCKIVANDNGEMEEIHILSDTRRSPKQLSRDIQSALMSKFGQGVDHKIISIAQIDERAMEDRDFRLKLKTVEFSTSGTRAEVKVILEKDNEIYEGKASGINSSINSQRLLSKATLAAIENFLGVDDSFILEDIKIIPLAGRDAVITAINFIGEYGEQIFCGCALVNRDNKEAVVKSTLDAVNRRIIKYFSEN